MSSSSDEERLSGDDRQVPLNEPVSPFFATPSGRNSPSLFIRALVGVSMIALVVFAWVAEAEYLQLVTVGSPETGSAYAKPWFMVYLIVSCYIFALPVWAVWRFKFRRTPFISWRREVPRQMLINALILSILQTFGGYAWFASLPITTVSANTTIFNSSAAFVFVFSFFIVKERVSVLKIAALVASIGGVVLVAYFDSGEVEHTELSIVERTLINIDAFFAGQSPPPAPGTVTTSILGYVWVIVSMLCWALFVTLYGKYAADTTASEAPERNFLWMGLIGLACLLLQWPIFLPLHFFGVERFSLPSIVVFLSLLGAALLDVLVNLASLIGIAFTSPLFVAVGSVLTVPASMLVDKLVHMYSLPWPALCGALLVLTAFVLINLDAYLYLKKQQRPERTPLMKNSNNSTISEILEQNNDENIVRLEDSADFSTMRVHGLSSPSYDSGTVRIDHNSNKYEDVGTMRILSADGREAAIGTIRFFPGQDCGTFVYNRSVALDESTGDDIPLDKKNTPIWLKMAKKFNIRRDEVEHLKPTPPSQSYDEPPAWLKTQLPEDWEVNILALEKGEWIPEMEKSKEAFKRFKRDRKAVRSSLYRPPSADFARSSATSEDDNSKAETASNRSRRPLKRNNRRSDFGSGLSSSSIVEEEESEISLNASSDEESESTLDDKSTESSDQGTMKKLRKKEAKSLQKLLMNLQ